MLANPMLMSIALDGIRFGEENKGKLVMAD